MSARVTLVDYGLGNIKAFFNIYKRLNIQVQVAKTADELAGAERIVLPGVGAFDWAMGRLDASGMRETLEEMVLGKGRPVLGICVGMQMMGRRSDEGERVGLGWIDGDVRLLPSKPRGDEKILLPHMGWNDVKAVGGNPLFRGLDDWRFYFLHSFYFHPLQDGLVVGSASYHGEFACAVSRANLYGVQFHPEKSHHWGVRLLTNFAEL